jgi:hypothetical protein
MFHAEFLTEMRTEPNGMQHIPSMQYLFRKLRSQPHVSRFLATNPDAAHKAIREFIG